MPRLPREDRERNEAIVERHRVATTSDPVTVHEALEWRESLSRLDGPAGNAERLAVCRDLLRHAPEDAMLDSDLRLIKAAIVDLEEELTHVVFKPARPSVRAAEPEFVELCDEDDDSADNPEDGPVAILDFDDE